MKNKQKGIVGEQAVILDLLKRGYRVLTPVNEDSPYDILVDNNGIFTKIQVKYRDTTLVPNRRSYCDSKGSHTIKYTKEEVDVYALYNPSKESILYVPFELGGITLKESPSSTWSYLAKDFLSFPCKKQYNKKLLLQTGNVIDEATKNTIVKSFNNNLSIKDNAIVEKIPYHTYRKWITNNNK